MNPVRELRQRVGLTQSELAERGGTSQPTIAAYEAGSKSPTVRTVERLVESVGMEIHVVFVAPMTREDRRSLALHRAIATRLLAEPEATVAAARRNLRRMARQTPGASSLWREWRRALALSVEDLAELLTDPRPLAREMRHVTPFAGVLTPSQRWDVYRRFRAEASGGA